MLSSSIAIKSTFDIPWHCIERADGGLVACYCQIHRFGPESIRLRCAFRFVPFVDGIRVVFFSREDQERDCSLSLSIERDLFSSEADAMRRAILMESDRRRWSLVRPPTYLGR